MKPLTSAGRRSLKSRAHALHPVVIVGSTGLSEGVMAEIERCLGAHELIKIRVCGEDRRQRKELLAQICERSGARPVQHIGRILLVYREKPPSPPHASGRDSAAPKIAKSASRLRPETGRRAEPDRPGVGNSTRDSMPRGHAARPTKGRRRRH